MTVHLHGTVKREPVVDYLVLTPEPRLRARKCADCGAHYFDRRNACASCEGDAFEDVLVAPEGAVRAFTIVHHAAPDVVTPFVAAVIDCDGISVRGNIINIPADPTKISLHMKVRLATYSLGVKGGVEAIAYGFEPA